MNLNEQGNMFTETSFVENEGEIKAELSMIDLDSVIGRLSVSPAPYESSCRGADGSSVSRVKSDVSGGDRLSSFNSISVIEHVEPGDDLVTDSTKADAFDSIDQDDSYGERLDEGKGTSEFVSLELASFTDPSEQRDSEAEVFDKTDKTCKPDHPLIVYTSSRRRSACYTKSNQNHESGKPSRCRRIANKNSGLDLSSLQILRRSRSSLSKTARSSVWGGHLGNLLPNLGHEEKPRRARGGKGKRNVIRDQKGQKSIGKSCPPTGHISLKIKIGNKGCSMVNATENFSVSRKEVPDLFETMENKLGEKVPANMVLPHERNSEKVATSEASALRTHLDVRDACDNPSFCTSSDFHKIISQGEGYNLGASTENHSSDVGNSPDSEVINPVPDALFCEKGLPDIQDGLINSMPRVSPSDVPSLVLSQKKSKKGKKKDKLHQVGDFTMEGKLTGPEATDKTKIPGPMYEFSSLSLPKAKSKKGTKKNKLCDVGDCSVESKLVGAETRDNATVPAGLGEGEKVCDALIPCSSGKKFPKCSQSKGGSKGRSRILDLPGKKDKASKKKENKTNLGFTLQVSAAVGASGAGGMESFPEAGNQTPSGLGETGAEIKDLSGSINSSQFSSGGPTEQCIPPRSAWVLCDECQKWRRIPATLADQIEETNCGWTCKDNVDKGFADCSIPQEKSNSEINEELEISDEENACDAFAKSNQNRSKVAQQSSWSLIKSNLFLHRSRKTQTIDEVMVCHCKPPSDGRMGCGNKCLNRMLNIECVRGTCPCGELCSNQQFQRRKYAKLKWFRCGKKGYGLQALEDISEGQFLIEYVGEVLDIRAYEARQREYALDGHKHFYFMTLNGSEVIDACAKGNLGRFINHSCDPNCRTEKWMINGEVCVGLFSLRDIKKGEEVTFDYNYVRVFGAAAKKCVCGSPNCRGYIGGDPTNSEVIVQDDSDDEFSEPVMTCGDKEMKEDWSDIISNSVNNRENEISNEPPEYRYSMKKLINAVGDSIAELHTSETSTQKVEGLTSAEVVETMVQNRFEVDDSVGNDSAANAKLTYESLIGSLTPTCKVESEGLPCQKHSSSQFMDTSLQLDKAMPSAHELATTIASLSKSLSDTIESQRKLKYAAVGESHELSKSNSLAKTKRSSSSIKKGKLKPNAVNEKATLDVDKSNAALHKSKKLPELLVNSHLETVEGKLNDLLDAEGGISKRKDASRGYLKLLFLTAASGNNGHGEAIQSNRDLSMILDALLKTKSRTVLVDIINKNGLQMLHNIMKRYRKEFIKTPILRKLLKVLEYLAVREIVTLEHITGGPPRAGVESFRDSILVLTEHADKQVHQIARNFRDRWIPRSLRRNCCMEMDDGRIEFQQRSSNGGMSVSYDNWSDRVGKSSEPINSCKPQPVSASSIIDTPILDNLPFASGTTSTTNGTKPRKRKSRWDNPIEEYPHSRSRAHLEGDEKPELDEDAPPGFSTPCKSPIIPSNVILGDSQPSFIARMPLSYGVSCSVMQQSGAHLPGSSVGWSIAPGVPFHPFPPLPPYACTTSAAKCAEKAEQENNVSVANGCTDFQQGGSYNLGRNYFRQQKWNHSKMGPPWVRMRNGVGNGGNDFKDSEVNWRGEFQH